MRITRETLLKIARDTVQMQLQRDRRLVCVYLTGSLLSDEPLLGGTTDIDLIYVHDGEPLIDREIQRLTDDVHLDILHLSQAFYHQPRHLRVDSWTGSFLCSNALALHDSHHWFEFTQAAVCAQFNLPEYVYQRVQAQASEARRIWMGLRMGGSHDGETKTMLAYLKSLEKSANAVATFSGPPLTERRLMAQFPQRAKAINRPGLAAGLADLIWDGSLPHEAWLAWQQPWNVAFEAAGQIEYGPAVLNSARRGYYTRAAAAQVEHDPAAALWIALHTWTLALDTLGADAPGLSDWRAALETLKLDSQNFSQRLDQLDAYLDSIEEILETWARENGIEA